MQTVLAKSYKVQALFARFSLPKGERDIIALLKKLNDFVDYKLSQDELGQSMKPGYIIIGEKVLIRWTINNINVIIFFEGDPNDVMVDIIEELDHWRVNDPRYDKHLAKMKEVLADLAQRAGLVPQDLAEDDPAVEMGRSSLNNLFGPPNHLKGDTHYMAVVAWQGMGCDPWVRSQKTKS